MMFQRELNIPLTDRFFLFGPRGTGKSSLLEACFPPDQAHFINLLLPSVEDRFFRHPELLIAEVSALPPSIKYIVIDEIQKVPKLLDVVHHLIEKSPRLFAMTGSSARKLRHGGANLLAGIAFTKHLFPLTSKELRSQFVLDDVLRWGSLPKIYQLDSAERKDDFLFAYANS